MSSGLPLLQPAHHACAGFSRSSEATETSCSRSLASLTPPLDAAWISVGFSRSRTGGSLCWSISLRLRGAKSTHWSLGHSGERLGRACPSLGTWSRPTPSTRRTRSMSGAETPSSRWRRSYVQEYATPSERPLYIVAPTYVARDDVSIETAISQYLDAYSAVLNLLQDGSLSPGEVFTFVHLDSVVLECSRADENQLDLRMSLLGPWHPLVVAKRFMVQHWIYAAAEENGRLAKQHRRLASLFERVDGFRVVPGFDADSLGLDVSFAFPTSDPGWHLAVASGAFSALAGSTFGSLRGFGEQLRRSQGLRSPLYLAGTDLWSESFVRSFQRSHPSRRQLGLRVSRGLDARPVVDSCARLLGDQRARSGRLGALLPGGIHLFLEERLDERQQLPWQQPAVFVYEALQDARCYENFHPDILLLPQREEVRPAWLPGRTEEGLAVPRGRDRGAVFSMPLVDLSTDRHGLPVSRIQESGEAGVAERDVTEGARDGDLPPVGEGYRRALALIDALASHVRPQRPALVQELGLPPSLRCDWTVLPGAHVDAGALATYISGRGAAEGEERALWDYRLDVGRSLRSYFIVCKVPKSVLSSLTAKSLALGPEDASSALRELAEVGFAVGETMRSGKAAVGVLGVVGALRLARAAWAAGEANGRRWCTVLLPVDCFTDLLVAPPDVETTSKRTDLLAINLAWRIEGPPTLTISPCAVECKYVSATYPASTVQDALGQAEATYQVVSQLLSLAQSEGGMHARLALCHILRFGLRLLVARGDVTMADEQAILDATLSGSFDLLPPIAPSLLVTTSCGTTGDGAVDVRAGGWWVQLTADCWPREIPPLSNPLVRQLSKVFPAVDPHTDDGGARKGGEATSTSSPRVPRVPVVFVNRLGRTTVHRRPLAATAKTMRTGLPAPKLPRSGTSRTNGKRRQGLRRPPTTSSTRSLQVSWVTGARSKHSASSSGTSNKRAPGRLDPSACSVRRVPGRPSSPDAWRAHWRCPISRLARRACATSISLLTECRSVPAKPDTNDCGRSPRRAGGPPLTTDARVH